MALYHSTMTVTIPAELDEFVRAKVLAGEFSTPDAVIAAALSAWQGQEVFASMNRDEVESRLLEAIDSPRTPWSDGKLDEIAASLRQKHGAS